MQTDATSHNIVGPNIVGCCWPKMLGPFAWALRPMTNKSAEWNVFLEFKTAVDVEHGSCMFVLPYGRILFKFSTTKNGLVIILEVLYDGEFIWLYGNMIFMVIRCSPL